MCSLRFRPAPCPERSLGKVSPVLVIFSFQRLSFQPLGHRPVIFRRIFIPLPAFLQDLLQTKHLSRFDPWVTQRFPLGHPDFSTGSPKVFHRVTQGSPDQEPPKTPNAAEGNSRCG